MNNDDKLDLILRNLEQHDKKFDLIFNKLEQHDEKFDLIFNKLEQHDEKFDLIFNKLEQHDEKFDLIFNKLEQHDKKFEQIDQRFEQIDERFEKIDKKFDEIDGRLDGIDTRITILKSDNLEEHKKMFTLLNSLSSSFLRHEVEIDNKIRILFDANVDYSERKNIYDSEITKLNDIIANHSVRISNLERQNNQFDNMNYKQNSNRKRFSLKENVENLEKILCENPILES